MVTLTMTCQLALLCIEEVQLSWKYITPSKLPSLCAIKHLLFDDPYTQNLLSPKMDEKWLKQLEMNLENEDGEELFM